MMVTMRSLVALLVLLPILSSSALAQKKADIQEGPIRLGAILSLTGSESKFGAESYRGFLLAVEEANRNGGISGTRIDVDTVDDLSQTQGAIDAYDRLVSQRVSAILGPVASGRMISLGWHANSAGIAMVTPDVT